MFRTPGHEGLWFLLPEVLASLLLSVDQPAPHADKASAALHGHQVWVGGPVKVLALLASICTQTMQLHDLETAQRHLSMC